MRNRSRDRSRKEERKQQKVYETYGLDVIRIYLAEKRNVLKRYKGNTQRQNKRTELEMSRERGVDRLDKEILVLKVTQERYVYQDPHDEHALSQTYLRRMNA